MYSPEPRRPTEEQLKRLRAAARMTGLAVERGRAEEALREKRKRELELEAQLRQAAKMEALGVLAGGIAHDFNNVLSTILSNAEFAHSLVETNPEAQESLSAIIEASKRAGQFCLQMLAYAGRGSLTRSQIEIGALIPEISSLVQAAVSKKTTIEYALHQQEIYIDGDENQLLQVIMNLITNAADAIGENEGQIVVSSDLAYYNENDLRRFEPQVDFKAGEYVRLRVSDTGSGMDEATIERIFDPFFTTKLSGHGLGLSAVKGIVNQHGGTIQIDSELGKGTTFTVILPTVKQIDCPEEKGTPSTTDIENKLILIAEDEKTFRSILSRVLKRAGFEVLEAANGQEAVDIFSAHRDKIDCVLLDLSMPKLNGEETQQALHALRNDLPIVMMSGFSELEIVNRFRDAGIAGCLQKPVSNDELVDTIRNVLSKKEASS